MTGRAAEVGVVSRFPAVHDHHAVGAQGAPVVEITVSPKCLTVASRKPRPGEEVAGFSTTSRSLYSGLSRSSSETGTGRLWAAKYSLIVVDADIAIIHRQGAVLRVELELGRDFRQERRGIGFINPGIKGAGEEGVVHPVEHIGQRGILAEDGLVERRPGIAAFQEDNFDIVGLLESSDDRLAGGKGVVGHDGQRDRAFGRARRKQGEATAGRQ